MDFFFKTCGTFTYNETKKKTKKKPIMVKMFLLSLYLFDIVNTSKNSHASKMLGIVGICVNNFNEMFVGFKNTLRILRRPYNEQLIQFLFEYLHVK